MPRSFLFVLCILGSLAPIATGKSKEGRVPQTRIAVFYQAESRLPERTLSELKHELQRIAGSSDLLFDWRRMEDSKASDSHPDLVVVKFKGSCQAESRMPLADTTGALAFAHSADGRVLPFIDLECDRIRRFIEPETKPWSQKRREFLLGRALGRLLAHEFYHLFAGTKTHGLKGLTKEALSREELLSDRPSPELANYRR
jgi:hypothetical protein